VEGKKFNRSMSRRELLRWMALGGAGVVAAACGPTPTPEVIEKIVTKEVEKEVVKEVEKEVVVTKEVEKVVTPTPVPEMELSGELEMIMRNSFIADMNEIQRNQIAQFAEETGVDIEASWAREWRQMYSAAVESKSGDIAELFGPDPMVFGDSLEDLTDICEALGEEYGGWYDVAKDVSVDENGVWRCIPRAYTAHAFNYRVSFFGEVGYPDGCETYDDYLDCATKLAEAGLPRVGNTVSQTGPNDSASFCYSLLWSFGGMEVEEDGKTVAINSQATRDALKWMVEFGKVAYEGITGFDEGGNNQAFMNGDVSCTQNATSIYWASESQAPEIHNDMSHFKYPAGPGGYHQLVEMNELALFAHSQNKEAGKAVLRWLMEPVQFVPLVQIGITFYSPLLNDYDDNPAMPFNVNPVFKPLKGLAHDGHMPGWPSKPSRASGEAYANQTLVNMFASVLLGEDIETAISIAEEELKAVYEA
jgi:multiple sugar transport system substrate-binding protein